MSAICESNDELVKHDELSEKIKEDECTNNSPTSNLHPVSSLKKLDQCLTLAEIIQKFSAPISEEYAFAIIYQCMKTLSAILNKYLSKGGCDSPVIVDIEKSHVINETEGKNSHVSGILSVRSTENILLDRDGRIHEETFVRYRSRVSMQVDRIQVQQQAAAASKVISSSDELSMSKMSMIDKDRHIPSSKAMCSNKPSSLQLKDSTSSFSSMYDFQTIAVNSDTEDQIISRLGLVIYSALDFGLNKSEQRTLSPELESLLDLMTSLVESNESSGGEEEDEVNVAPVVVQTSLGSGTRTNTTPFKRQQRQRIQNKTSGNGRGSSSSSLSSPSNRRSRSRSVSDHTSSRISSQFVIPQSSAASSLSMNDSNISSRSSRPHDTDDEGIEKDHDDEDIANTSSHNHHHNLSSSSGQKSFDKSKSIPNPLDSSTSVTKRGHIKKSTIRNVPKSLISKNSVKILSQCAHHLAVSSEADSHFRAVCRALFMETIELTTFLNKAKNVDETTSRELHELAVQDWTHLWIETMNELRTGVKLKKADFTRTPIEYQLTPFEILMDDIRRRRYKLNKIMVDGELPLRVKYDAHNVILDFIRSRPPLKPVSHRKLAPARRVSTPQELLMDSIRNSDCITSLKRVAEKEKKYSNLLEVTVTSSTLTTPRGWGHHTGIRSHSIGGSSSPPIRKILVQPHRSFLKSKNLSRNAASRNARRTSGVVLDFEKDFSSSQTSSSSTSSCSSSDIEEEEGEDQRMGLLNPGSGFVNSRRPSSSIATFHEDNDRFRRRRRIGFDVSSPSSPPSSSYQIHSPIPVIPNNTMSNTACIDIGNNNTNNKRTNLFHQPLSDDKRPCNIGRSISHLTSTVHNLDLTKFQPASPFPPATTGSDDFDDSVLFASASGDEDESGGDSLPLCSLEFKSLDDSGSSSAEKARRRDVRDVLCRVSSANDVISTTPDKQKSPRRRQLPKIPTAALQNSNNNVRANKASILRKSKTTATKSVAFKTDSPAAQKLKEWTESPSSSQSGHDLTLDEVVHIRTVLTKAKLDGQSNKNGIKSELEKGKLCFLCVKVKFGFFSWAYLCRICKRTVCSTCCQKIRIPTNHFSKIPVISIKLDCTTVTSNSVSISNVDRRLRRSPSLTRPQERITVNAAGPNSSTTPVRSSTPTAPRGNANTPTSGSSPMVRSKSTLDSSQLVRNSPKTSTVVTGTTADTASLASSLWGRRRRSEVNLSGRVSGATVTSNVSFEQVHCCNDCHQVISQIIKHRKITY